MSATACVVSDERILRQIRELQHTGRYFFERGWSVGTSSNYSVVLSRDPLQLLVTASGKHKGMLRDDDFVRVDFDGRPIDSNQPKSSAETLLHIAAARQPGVGAVLHTHSVWGTILSDHYFEKGGLEIRDYEMLKGLQRVDTHEHGEWIPIFANTQNIAQLAVEVEEQFARLSHAPHAYLIYRHGLYTWGRDLEEARRHVEVLEFLFECIGRQLPVGGRTCVH